MKRPSTSVSIASPSVRGRSVFKRLGYLLSAHWLREGLSAIFMVLLARAGTETYGEFLLALNLGYMLRFASEFGLNQHLATLLARGGHVRRDILLQVTCIKLVLLSAAILVMIGFVRWQGYSPRLSALCILIGSFVGLESLANSFFVSCQVLGRQDVEARVRGVAGLLGYGWGLFGLLSGQPILVVALFKPVETVVALVVALRGIFRRMLTFRFRTPLAQLWGIWREGVVFTLMAFAAITYNKINMFFLQRYAGAGQVAQYGATWQIVDGLSVLVSGMLLGKVLFPIFIRLYEKRQEEFAAFARVSARWLLAASLPVMFILWAESDRMIGLIYGEQYGEAALLQRYLVPCVVLAYLHNLCAYLMISMKRQRLLLAMYLCGLVFNLLFCLMVIPGNPLVGTALAITITKGFVCCLTLGYCQLQIGLLRTRDLLLLLLVVACGALLYAVGVSLDIRMIGEIFALVPILLLCWRWKKQHDARLLLVEGDR